MLSRADTARLLASGFGAGYLPKAPGTWGSLVGLAIGVPLLAAAPAALAGFILLTVAVAAWAIPEAAQIPWRPGSAASDPGWVTIDEIAGQCIALLGLHGPGLLGVALAFGLFRLLDIAKPGPIGWADRLGGGFGIMADDILAGAIVAVVLRAALG